MSLLCKLSIENDVGNVCISMEEVFIIAEFLILIIKEDEVVSPEFVIKGQSPNK